MCVCVRERVCATTLKMLGLYEDINIKVFYNKAKREIIHSTECERERESQGPHSGPEQRS